MLLILFTTETQWDSCKDINSGLVQLYKEINPDLEIVYASDHPDSGLNLLKKIKTNKPKKIIFVDHQVRISKELYHTVKQLNSTSISSLHFIFHVYGCFVERFSEWEFVAKYLKNAKVDFIASSSAQAGVVDKCLNLKSKCLVLPFPVDEKKFNSIEPISKESMGIGKNEKVVLYAGRVSPGKNVVSLMNSINRINLKSDEKVHLLIIGTIDDMSWPNKKENLNGFMSHKFSITLKKINKETKYIHYIPHTTDKNKLFGYYQLADVVASLSTMVFEDYGMSIADAVVLNKKVLCTYWGGYKDFGKYSPSLRYVDVQDKGDYFYLDEEQIDNLLLSQIKKPDVDSYEGGLNIKILSLSLTKQLEKSKYKILSISKNGKIFLLIDIFEILKNSSTRKLYDTYWL